jgi:ADP-dependent NAD(P)H-hydrate dehydratase / NAD(P)H-hydrate epimerase
MRMVTVEQMRALEQEADSQGLPYRQMMVNAGQGLAQYILSHFAGCKNKVVLGLVGSGNNGGDALVALTVLLRNGWQVVACLVKPRQANDEWISAFREQGGTIFEVRNDGKETLLESWLLKAEILLDGVIGTGFHLPLEKGAAFILGRVADFPHRPFTIAVDCPSGVDCTSGEAAAECIPAQLTICMAAIKNGLLRLPAFSFVGDLKIVDIGLSTDLPSWAKTRDIVADPAQVSSWMPGRPLDAHKGSFGTVLVAAGSRSYPGAVLLAGRAAYRMGVGLVRIAIPASIQLILAGHLPEATWLPLPEEDGYFSSDAIPVLKSGIENVNCMLLGPGWGMGESVLQFLRNWLRSSHLPPLVVDADGLRHLAQVHDWQKNLPRGSVLTPHPGEMSALTGLGIQTIQQDRVEMARKFAIQWECTVVLKGALTVIASPQGEVVVVPVATPALARAGTGDVLAGMLASLIAQGLNGFKAAVCAAWVHARAGQLAARRLRSTASVLASDVIESIPDVLAVLE